MRLCVFIMVGLRYSYGELLMMDVNQTYYTKKEEVMSMLISIGITGAQSGNKKIILHGKKIRKQRRANGGCLGSGRRRRT